jgi:hypothetical protein
MYYGIFLIAYMAVVCGTLLIAKRELPRQRLIALLAAAAILTVAMIPVGRAYLAARKVVGERGRDEVVQNSATWRNYLAATEVNAVYGKITARFMEPERRLFPGFVAVALAIIGLVPRKGKPAEPTENQRAVPLAYALGLLLAFDVSLGFNGLTYRALYDYFLPFRALRIPARMGLMVGFSLRCWRGMAARIADRCRRPTRAARAALIGALMLVDTRQPRCRCGRAAGGRRSYADLVRDAGDSPTSVIFEFPTGNMRIPVLYYSTFHWQYLINGYSGFFPPSYVQIVNAVRDFPDERSISAIKQRGTRYLVIHGEWLYGARYEELVAALDRRPDMTLVSRHPWQREDKHTEISVYRVGFSLDAIGR